MPGSVRPSVRSFRRSVFRARFSRVTQPVKRSVRQADFLSVCLSVCLFVRLSDQNEVRTVRDTGKRDDCFCFCFCCCCCCHTNHEHDCMLLLLRRRRCSILWINWQNSVWYWKLVQAEAKLRIFDSTKKDSAENFPRPTPKSQLSKTGWLDRIDRDWFHLQVESWQALILPPHNQPTNVNTRRRKRVLFRVWVSAQCTLPRTKQRRRRTTRY